LSEAKWQEHWRAERLFLTADGDKDQLWGNLTIRWHPDEHWVEIALPRPLVHLAKRPHGRYRLGCPVTFNYRGDEVAAQAATGAVRYDISCDPKKDRFYIDASWKCSPPSIPDLDQLRQQRVLAVDLNEGHLAAMVVDPSGNPVGRPIAVPFDLTGPPTPTRDGRLRQAISVLVNTAKDHGCRAIVIEDLDFKDARELGREQSGNRPSRGKRAKSFRHMVAGLPTARFRDRLVQMAANAGLSVIAVDPAYTSRWGAEHWLCSLGKTSVDASGHHAAAVVIARRGLGQRARQRRRCDSTPAEHGGKRAAHPVVRPTVAGCPAVLSEPRMRDAGTRKARGQPHLRRKTQPAKRDTPVDQVTQDRSGPPTKRDSVPLSV
jgi:IS605 OrfB family transposase